jgi:hypothetical protein
MSKPVATAADVSPAASSGTTDSASNTGAWSAGPTPLDVSTAPKLMIGGAPVALAASQTFTFSGSNPSGAPVTYPSSVTLEAKPTKVRSGGKFVLVDGDAADDASAALATPPNRISVSSSRKLRTT